MKVAFFHFLTAEPIRLFIGREVDAERIVTEERYVDCPFRVLEGTPFADTMSVVALPPLPDFDAACAAD